jgi:YkoY family integral membrane protein
MHRPVEAEASAAGGSFWKTVVIVELTDIAFAVDSIVAAVAMIDSKDKLWVVYAGAMIGIILLRIAAGFFIQLLDKWPGLEHLAYALIAWVAVKLLFMAGHHFEESSPGALPFHVAEISPAIFWSGMGLIAAIGTIWALARGRSDEE